MKVDFGVLPGDLVGYEISKLASAIRQSELPDTFAVDIEPGGAAAASGEPTRGT